RNREQRLPGLTASLDFSFHAPPVGKVELIGALGELRGACDLVVRNGGDFDPQIQPGEEFRQPRGFGAELFAPLVLLVERGALPVFSGEFEAVKSPTMPEKLGN